MYPCLNSLLEITIRLYNVLRPSITVPNLCDLLTAKLLKAYVSDALRCVVDCIYPKCIMDVSICGPRDDIEINEAMPVAPMGSQIVEFQRLVRLMTRTVIFELLVDIETISKLKLLIEVVLLRFCMTAHSLDIFSKSHISIV
jgi:hypothetical protein